MLADVNRIKVNYRIDGKTGAPWLTFITGIANDISMWDGQIPALENDFRILRYDLRGHGDSEATEDPYSLDMLMDDLLGLWDHLGIEKSNLVGLGLGGALSIGVGTRHSDRLIKLVPCCCRAAMTPEFAAIWPKFVETVKEYGMEGMVEPTAQRWFSEEFKAKHPEEIEKVRSMIRRTDPRGYFGCIAAFLTLDYEDGLKNISVPTLFISGTEDRLGGPPEIMERLAEAIPNGAHLSIPKAAHICNIQNPDGFNAALAGFLKS